MRALCISLLVVSSGSLAAQGQPPVGIDPGPAPYIVPPVGVVLTYTGGVLQRVTESSGMRMSFLDRSGRRGALIGLFVIDNPAKPGTVDLGPLRAFWPLRVGGNVVVPITIGAERWQATLKVVGVEQVKVPAGTYRAYVVEGQQVPQLVANPKASATVSKWWYAPELGAVVRFMTTTTVPGQKAKIRRHELTGITAPPKPAR